MARATVCRRRGCGTRSIISAPRLDADFVLDELPEQAAQEESAVLEALRADEKLVSPFEPG